MLSSLVVSCEISVLLMKPDHMYQTHSSILNQGKHRRGRHVINWKKSGNQI